MEVVVFCFHITLLKNFQPHRFVSCSVLQLVTSACRVFFQRLGRFESLKRTWVVSRLLLIASLVFLHFSNDQNRNKAKLIDFK